MKKLFTILAVAMCSTLAMAQTNQYFWAGGRFIMGNPIDQIDSITFGQLDDTDSIMLYLPHTIKVVHDTVIQYVTIHDTINPCAVPEGAISGKFSVSDTKQVYFSKGNLQYHASTDTWRFAENQYDYIGADNANISPTYNGWIDLFGWGTGDNPTNHTIDVAIDNKSYSTFVDWGKNMSQNPVENEWFNMSYDQWTYLLYNRPNAENLRMRANIGGVSGMLILPDKGKNINEISLAPSFSFGIDSIWAQLEQSGVVFLPISGERIGQTIRYADTHGKYWSSTAVTDKCAYYTQFDAVNDSTNSYHYYDWGLSVRLVQEVK